MVHRNLCALLALVAGVSALPSTACAAIHVYDLEPHGEAGALSLSEAERVAAGVALRQACRAGDESARAPMGAIAADRVTQVELACDVAAWTEGQLDARAHVEASCSEALLALATVASSPVADGATHLRLGLPEGNDAHAMVTELASRLAA